jgi:hypothetical protein
MSVGSGWRVEVTLRESEAKGAFSVNWNEDPVAGEPCKTCERVTVVAVTSATVVAGGPGAIFGPVISMPTVTPVVFAKEREDTLSTVCAGAVVFSEN